MTVIVIEGACSQEVLPQRFWFERAPIVRVDSTGARLTGFPGDQLVPTRSGNLSFCSIWMVPLSWHVARFGLRWHYTSPSLLPRKTVLAGLSDLP